MSIVECNDQTILSLLVSLTKLPQFLIDIMICKIRVWKGVKDIVADCNVMMKYMLGDRTKTTKKSFRITEFWIDV